jgi:hypothetical protein
LASVRIENARTGDEDDAVADPQIKSVDAIQTTTRTTKHNNPADNEQSLFPL